MVQGNTVATLGPYKGLKQVRTLLHFKKWGVGSAFCFLCIWLQKLKQTVRAIPIHSSETVNFDNPWSLTVIFSLDPVKQPCQLYWPVKSKVKSYHRSAKFEIAEKNL